MVPVRLRSSDEIDFSKRPSLPLGISASYKRCRGDRLRLLSKVRTCLRIVLTISRLIRIPSAVASFALKFISFKEAQGILYSANIFYFIYKSNSFLGLPGVLPWASPTVPFRLTRPARHKGGKSLSDHRPLSMRYGPPILS